MKIEVKTLSGEAAGEIELSDAIFALPPRPDIVQRMVVYQLNKRRSGNHKAKERWEVNRVKKKAYKQKGTGRARHGAMNANIFRGGGVVHGPRVRSHATDLPKKVRELALKTALSAKATAGEIYVIEAEAFAEPRTKLLAQVLAKLELHDALVVGGDELDRNFSLAVRNLPHVEALPAQGINVYDIIRKQKLVLTRAAVEALEARLK